MSNPVALPRRPLAATVIAICFALIGLNATAQVVLRLFGGSTDSALLTTWQGLVGASGLAAAVLAWRQQRAAVPVGILNGIITGSMIVSLGKILDLAPEAQRGLWFSGGLVLVITLALAWGLRRSQMRKY